MKSGKQQMTERIELPNKEKSERMEKRNLKTLENNESKHTEMKEKKGKRIPQENEKTTRNQTTEISSKGYTPGLSSALDTRDHS